MADKVKPEARVTKDPFAPTMPYQVLARMPGDDESPNGYVLSWLNEKTRNSGVTGGWKGWEIIEWDHPIMAEIHKYIPSAPTRMRGGEHIDNTVRRADLVLCRINADWFDERQEASARISRERVADLTVPEGQEILPGVKSIGGGRRADKNPTFGDGSLAAKLRNT